MFLSNGKELLQTEDALLLRTAWRGVIGAPARSASGAFLLAVLTYSLFYTLQHRTSLAVSSLPFHALRSEEQVNVTLSLLVLGCICACATLSMVSLFLHTLLHGRAPCVLDKGVSRLRQGARNLCPLSHITHVQIVEDRWGGGYYRVELGVRAGQEQAFLLYQGDEMGEAHQVAVTVATFINREVIRQDGKLQMPGEVLLHPCSAPPDGLLWPAQAHGETGADTHLRPAML